jgi:hypothetical protein
VSEPHVTWAKGGTASFVIVVDDAVTLRSSIPSPPGSRLEGALVSDASVALKVKIHSSKHQPDGSFLLMGKLLDASRPMRDRVASLVTPSDRPA